MQPSVRSALLPDFADESLLNPAEGSIDLESEYRGEVSRLAMRGAI